MKTQTKLSLVIWLGLFWIASAFAQNLNEQAQYEGAIKEKISDKVKLVIAPELFKLVVNAKVDKIRERVILEGETTSQTDGTNQKKASVENALPGFAYVDETRKEEASDKVKSASTNKFKYNEFIKLSALSVHLLLDDTIPQDKKDYVASIVKQDLESTFGNLAKLEVKQLAFVAAKEKGFFEALNSWFTDYLTKRGGSGLDILYVITLGLLFLLGIVGLIMKFRRSQIAKSLGIPAANGNNVEKKEDGSSDDFAIQGMVNRLIDRVSSSPLEVSCFLKQLQNENKNALLAATKTPALKAYFLHIMGTPTNAKDDPKDKKAIKERLNAIEQDLERFLKIQLRQVEQKFGYLPLLDDRQIFTIIENTGNKLGSLNAVSRFLSKSQLNNLMEKLSIDEKVEVFKLMQLDVKASPADLDRLDAMLRQEYLKVKANSAVIAADQEEVEREFLENDDQVVEVIQKLSAQNFPLKAAHQKYLITFEKLLSTDSKTIKEVFSRVSNDTLAKAFAREAMNTKIHEGLGETRGKLIESMKAHFHHVDRNEIKKAQIEILKAYWAMV